jgi:hypothetical protein
VEQTPDIGARLDRLEQLMLDGFRQINEQFQQVNERITAVDGRIDRLEAYIVEFRSEMIKRLDAQDSRLDIQAASMHLMHGTVVNLAKSMDDVQSRLGKLERAA